MDRPLPPPRFLRSPAEAPELPSLAALLDEARRHGLEAVVAVSPHGDEPTRALAKRRHDVKAALRTLGFSVKALASGYRFDDDKAPAKIEAIAKAVQVLEREAELVLRLLAADA